jgi:hypothetical protein
MTRPFGIIEGGLLGIMLILWVMFPAQDSNLALFNAIVRGPINAKMMMDILVMPSSILTPPWNQIWNAPSLDSPVTGGIHTFLI